MMKLEGRETSCVGTEKTTDSHTAASMMKPGAAVKPEGMGRSQLAEGSKDAKGVEGVEG
jgi:hypothetical protein